MVLKHCLSSLVLIVLLSSCYSGTKQNTVSGLFEEQEPDSLYVPAYAKGFSIAYYGDLKLIHVEDPWNSDAVGKYVLVGPGECPVKYKPAEIDYVRYPVRNWSAFSSFLPSFAFSSSDFLVSRLCILLLKLLTVSPASFSQSSTMRRISL